MIFSKIDDKLTCYDKGVILFGCGSAGCKIKKILERFGKDIICFVDNNKDKWGSSCYGIPVRSIKEMLSILNENEDFVIQIASEFSDIIEKQLLELGVADKRIISYWEFELRIPYLERYLYFKKKGVSIHDPVFCAEMEVWGGARKNEIEENIIKIALYDIPEIIFINTAPKTGNSSIALSFEHMGIPYIRGGHGYFKKIENLMQLKDKKIKMIAGVREPFSQFLSWIFQFQQALWDQANYWEKGGDVQKIFDVLLDREYKNNSVDDFYNIKKEFWRQTYFITNYFDEEIEKNFHINVYDYPFDCEKGYTIIRQGNIEIFIYQLEQLSRLVDVLGEFLNIKDFTLSSANVASEKWYHKYYQEARKNLKINRDIFDQIYSHKFVKHFYSEKQINEFRDKWSGNIS